MTEKTFRQLSDLGDHLSARRDVILAACRAAAEADSEQTTVSSLTRAQFVDHLPEVLDAFECKLRSRPGGANAAEADEQQKLREVKHGLHRWQQGYRLRELTHEWGHLHLCIHDELQAFATAHPDMDRDALAAANRELIQLVSDAISESTAQYARLEKEDAAGRARDLERALAQLGELEKRRGDWIRQAVHDLGGNVQALSGAAVLLGVPEIEETDRQKFSEMLGRGVENLRVLLADMMSLARLEAGEERRVVAHFDAAQVLTELTHVSQPFAIERRLWLNVDGPAILMAEGDAGKVRRLAQNLLINALKYTERGGVTVSWGEEDTARWWLMVKDTGPGFQGGPGAPMVEGLKEATASAREADEKAATAGDGTTHVLPQKSHRPESLPNRQQPGEGIGLSIVKRLCELLDASLELASSPETGTTFRVLLPRRYEPPK